MNNDVSMMRSLEPRNYYFKEMKNTKLPADTFDELVDKFGNQVGVPAIGAFFISYKKTITITDYETEKKNLVLTDPSFSLNKRIASTEEKEGFILAELIATYEQGEEPSIESGQSTWISIETFDHTPVEDQDFHNALEASLKN
jgi:hypothetical protein